MNRMQKYTTITLLAFCATMTAGCSDPKTRSSDVNRSEKLELSGTTWYDYGNGLINLANITRITSQASINASVMPKLYYKNEKGFFEYYSALPDEQKAILDAHADYCFDTLRSENVNQRYSYSWPAFAINASLGGFETGDDGEKLSNLMSDLKGYTSPEFAENCVVKLAGAASLQFDGFTVELEPYNKTLVFEGNKEGKFVKEDIDTAFDEMVGELLEGKTPWNGTYSTLIQK